MAQKMRTAQKHKPKHKRSRERQDVSSDPDLVTVLEAVNQHQAHRNLPMEETDLPLIKVVGISAGGKSTLVHHLRNAGYDARPVSQEHSNIPDLWQQFDTPDLLIYLDTTLEAQRARRPDVTWTAETLLAEQQRLDHARGHADLHINTAGQSGQAVFAIARTFLEHAKIAHAEQPLPPVTPTGMLRQDGERIP